jgi:hypothetical protein
MAAAEKAAALGGGGFKVGFLERRKAGMEHGGV